MKLRVCLLLFCLLPVKVYAGGQATIVETDAGYVVEYVGGEEDKKAVRRQEEEREAKVAEEQKKEERAAQRAERRAATKAAIAAEGD
jgi:hypothetical protein